MGKAISILVPTYNDECVTLVETLQRQCERLKITDGNGGQRQCERLKTAGKDASHAHAAIDRYEIIVGDDGSDDAGVVGRNKRINGIDGCRYIIYNVNKGRAAIRNALAREARYGYVLFIDSDVAIEKPDFIEKYVVSIDEMARFTGRDKPFCICGGYDVPRQDGMKDNLRYIYEQACKCAHAAGTRGKNPYRSFNSSNFLTSRDVMAAFPFDERFHLYGYEDVAFGRQLHDAGIAVRHIDNPVCFRKLEDNATYVAQTEEGMGNLAEFSDVIGGYSRLLKTVGTLRAWHVDGICRHVLRPFIGMMRGNLAGGKPSPRLFNVYKLAVLLGKMHDKCNKNRKNAHSFK